MDRQERTEGNDAQKAKMIFFAIAALAIVLLVWSFYTATKARQERDAARQESELLKQDNAKLEQMLKDQNQINDDIKKKLQACESKPKAKSVSKKSAAKSSGSKKKKAKQSAQ
jgi:Tfp pilus assembly protein PilO